MSEPLFPLDYEDSPFEHGWKQYESPGNRSDCLTIRKDPLSQEPILVKTGGWDSAVQYTGGGAWIKSIEHIYIATIQPESDFHIYFRVQCASGRSRYLVYGTIGPTGLNPSGEYAITLEGRNLHDGSWHSLAFNLKEDAKTCFGLEFQHLNWVCLRGNMKISEMIRISDRAELSEMWERLHSPWLISAGSLIGKNAHMPGQQDHDRSTTDELHSLRRLLAEHRENLRLIRDRKSQYVMETEIPLQVIKRERQLLKHIEELEQHIESRATPSSRDGGEA